MGHFSKSVFKGAVKILPFRYSNTNLHPNTHFFQSVKIGLSGLALLGRAAGLQLSLPYLFQISAPRGAPKAVTTRKSYLEFFSAVGSPVKSPFDTPDQVTA